MKEKKQNNEAKKSAKKISNYLRKNSTYSRKNSTYLKTHRDVYRIVRDSLMIILPLLAISISLYFFNISNKQFEDQTRKSDSIFKIQLENERLLNDIIVENLKKIQELTNNQMTIIDKQLYISTQQLDDQINSGIPNIILKDIELKDKHNRLLGKKPFGIIATFKNIGYRYAYDFNYKSYAISNNFDEIIPFSSNESSNYWSGAIIQVTNSPIIFKNFNIPFYYCIVVNYNDKLTRKNFVIKIYKIFCLRGSYGFWDCDKESEKKLIKSINDYLK